MSSRNTSPRKQVGEHETDEFKYPFESCCPWVEQRHIPHRAGKPLGQFPDNIKRWIWSAAGQNDGDPWDCIVELEPEENYSGVRFAYFHAWCDYTGFDCQGGAHVIVATQVSDLVEYGLSNSAYRRYMESTEESDSW